MWKYNMYGQMYFEPLLSSKPSRELIYQDSSNLDFSSLYDIRYINSKDESFIKDYFKEINLDTAYYAGIISSRKIIYSKTHLRIRNKNKETLMALKQTIQDTENEISLNISSGEYYEYDITSEEMIWDLINIFNIETYPRIYITEKYIPLIGAFLRGRFDANGTGTLLKYLPNSVKTMTFRPKSNEFDQWFYYILNFIIAPINVEESANPIKSYATRDIEGGIIYLWNIGGMRGAILYNYLSNIPVPYYKLYTWDHPQRNIDDLAIPKLMRKSKKSFVREIIFDNNTMCNFHGYYENEFGDKIDPINNVPDKNGVLWPDHYSKEYYQETTFGQADSIDWHVKQQFENKE